MKKIILVILVISSSPAFAGDINDYIAQKRANAERFRDGAISQEGGGKGLSASENLDEAKIKAAIIEDKTNFYNEEENKKSCKEGVKFDWIKIKSVGSYDSSECGYLVNYDFRLHCGKDIWWLEQSKNLTMIKEADNGRYKAFWGGNEECNINNSTQNYKRGEDPEFDKARDQFHQEAQGFFDKAGHDIQKSIDEAPMKRVESPTRVESR
jgi:hypothetical protein